MINNEPWFDSLESVVPFDLQSGGTDVYLRELSHGMTVMFSEEALILSVYIREEVRESFTNELAQAVSGMKALAKSFMLRGQTQEEDAWKIYSRDIEMRNNADTNLISAFPFLRAFAFVNKFEAIHLEVMKDFMFLPACLMPKNRLDSNTLRNLMLALKTPQSLIDFLKGVSGSENVLFGVKGCALKWLTRIADGNF